MRDKHNEGKVDRLLSSCIVSYPIILAFYGIIHCYNAREWTSTPCALPKFRL
ncbi:hypothetical protein M441DRAFT_293129 [Trichoderma asperellum CBS 433.97]|uniref:Uncharacterized protein n=1 Tax=Trichoderma asperellum (strain ATCC 204424 / CBS 433.97 / NBRC 101777) TaxID=1042311 RepID=A0A2T3YTA9_TRIA4|nr:hypothetical protein M441DRAFT_293129 [Trichoderma asperellum CBS 433.97]PTB35736.1 hypothetical protein M441DRAFT_293129 [Trichoderma asperellum CBS 433.97]